MSRLILSVAVFVLSAAVTAQSTYDAKILEYTGLRYTCEGQGTPVLKIQNTGSATMGTCVVETWKNGLMVNSFNWILAAPALTGDVRQPALPAVPAMSPGDQLEFHIISVNGEPDEDPLGNILTVDMNEVPAFSNGGEMEVRVELGDSPGSIVWSVTNHLNQVVASGGPYDEANTVVTDELDLPAGCYTFKSEDASRSVAPDAVVTVRRDANTLIVAADLSTPFRKGLRAGAPQACANQLTLELRTDSQGAETAWEILDMTTQDVVCTGGPYANAAQLYTEDCCLPDGCYRLVVTDGAGDGITGGGYLLRITNGARLIDNRLDQYGNGGYATGLTSAIAGNEGFCLPLGPDRLIHTSCDKLDWRTSPCSAEFIVANENTAVSAEWIMNQPNSAQSATTGYQFWFFDPNGGYSFKRFRSHRVSEGYTWSDANGNPTPWTRAAHCLLNNWASGNHLQQGVLYNVRVRSRVDGIYGVFGPTCRMMLDNAAAQCPRTQLLDQPSSQYHSCGQTRAIGNNTYVHAKPVRRMTINNQGNCVWQNANRYQFRFRLPAEQVTIVKTAPVGAGKYFVNTAGLSCGKTYEVDVRASFDGGSTWCHASDPYGQVCLFTTDACAGGLVEEPGSDDAPSLIEARMQLFPNPADGGPVAIRIDGDVKEAVSVEMRDATGKLVLARNFPHQEGAFQAVLETTSLRTGLYLVAVRSGSTLLVERLMVP